MSDTFPTVTPVDEQVPWESLPPTPDPIPDHTQSTGQAETSKRERPRANLGGNKKPRSGVRALTAKDAERLGNYYAGFALMLAPVNSKAAIAIAEGSDQCVEAWTELAAQNDGVRKFLLSMMEGSAWAKLIGAHMPILFAAIPPDMWERMPGLSVFRNPDLVEGEGGE